MPGGEKKLTPLPEEVRLAQYLRGIGKLAIAFSGGCDSVLLADFSARVLGPDSILLIHVNSPLTFSGEDRSAHEFAVSRNLPYLELPVDVLEDPRIVCNDKWRCYHCKKRIFSAIQSAAASRGFSALADGTNPDDRHDWRPGIAAADELGILHPFSECGIGKRRIRLLARRAGLSVWTLPAAACLASRIPTGVPLKEEVLRRCGAAEQALAQLGFSGSRVRALADGSASLEFRGPALSRAFRMEEKVCNVVRSFGFSRVVIHPSGYRQGSMNRL